MLSVELAQGVDAGMFVRDYNRAAGPSVLVYLHGLGDHGHSFETVVSHRQLSTFRHLVLDLPGHGRSVPAPRYAGIEAVADHIARWLGRRLGGNAVLVGHGMGGVIASLVAERHPDRVRAVVDVGGPKTLHDCTFLSRAAEQPLAEFASRGFAALREDLRRSSDSPHLAASVERMRLCDPRLFHACASEIVGLARDEGLAQRLGALRVPALFVNGKRGGASQRTLDLLASAGVTIAEVPDAGAHPFLESPHELATMLADALPRLMTQRPVQ
jgi:pimeloyl-ACP methyl ester carboxylesterase